MKKLISLLILCFSIVNAQDNEPTPWDFKWGFSSTPRPFVLDSFQTNSILTGFQWGGTVKMNNALLNNAATGSKYISKTETVNTPINLIHQPTWIDDTDYNPGYFGVVMMQYEPTLPLTVLNFGNILRPADVSNPIFGFLNRKGRILTDDTDANYSRMLLEKDSSYVDTKVLSEIHPVPLFESNPEGGQTNNYPGRMWYLTINLKRLYPAIETTKDNNVVLSLKIPYTKWNNGTGYIKFNKLPINSTTANFDLNFFESRGKAQEMATVTPAVDSISITRNMLPISSDGYESITISGEFATDNSIIYNPEFSEKYDSTEIKEFDIEVKYFGHTDVAIDYVRIENSRAHHLVRGKFDSLGTGDSLIDYRDRRGTTKIAENPNNFGDSIKVNTIKDIIQSAIDSIKVESNNWQDAKLYRLYFQDIEVPHFYWWGALRYVNKFANGIYIASDVENFPELYEYYTDCPNRYFGMKFSPYEEQMSQPFFRSTKTEAGQWADSAYKIMGYKYGFRGEQWKDTLSSGYETFFANPTLDHFDPFIFDNIKNYSNSVYHEKMKESNSIQTDWELALLDKYYNPINSRYLYLGNPWFINLFIGTNLGFQKFESSYRLNNLDSLATYVNVVSTKTAESIRLIMNTNILMGVKGILYDREGDRAIVSHDTNGKAIPYPFIGIGNSTIPVVYNNDSLYNYVENDTIGGDFVGGYSDVYNVWDYIVQDSISKYALIPTDRIYIGTKSVRLEMKKLIEWIRLNDIELMDLRLQASYSKGFKTFENWNPYQYSHWNYSPLKRIIKLDSVRTRKLFEPKHTMIHNTNPDYEFRDSSFFDVTLLQHKNSTAEDLRKQKNAVYIGIQNRRTDPLIFIDSIEVGTLDSLRELMFFSSAEFDDKVRYGGEDLWGVNHDSTWWQNQWWKRLGAREIKLPLNIYPYGNGTYILAQEIGLDSLDNLGWRYDDKYYHRVDTTLTYSDSLKAKLLPGQGKIIKLNYVPYFFNDPTKDSIPDNDSCYFCDIFNDFDLFEFEVVANTGEEDCCFDVSFTYNGNCTFEDIPFRLLFEGESGNTFLDSDPLSILKDSLGTNIRYKDFLLDLDSTTGTVSLGNFCISDSSNNYKISFFAGKDKDEKFIGCDRELQFEVSCGDEPRDCCDGLSVSDSMYTIGGGGNLPPDQFCTIWSVNPDFDTDCIYGISIGNENFNHTLIPVGSSPISSGFRDTICNSLAYCNDSLDTPAITYITMRFLGEDGTTICEFEVPIWIPCIAGLIDDSGFTDPPYKSSNPSNRKDSKTFKSESFDVTIWPNPTSGELNVEIDSKTDSEVDIKLVNNIGVGLSVENAVQLNKGKNERLYNLNSFSTGVYYLQIKGKEDNIVLPVILNK